MNSYSLVEHPIDFDVGLAAASIETVREYGVWFRRVLSQRVAELTAEIRRTADLADWQPDRAPGSLHGLEIWFGSQVEMRGRSEAEIETIRRRLTFPIEVPKETLTERTRSLATDLGMYFGEVILKNVPGTRWEQVTKGSRRYVDYGQPVVMGLGKVPLNPLRVITMTAYGIADGQAAALMVLYERWSEILSPSKAANQP